MAPYPAGWASWQLPFDWELALGLLRAMRKRSQTGEYHCVLDKRAGAVAVVAAEKRPLMGTLNDCYRLVEK